MPTKIVLDSEKPQFSQIFEVLLKTSTEVMNFLPTFYALVRDENSMRTMIQVVCFFLHFAEFFNLPYR